MSPSYLPEDGLAWNPFRSYPRNSACLCGSGQKFKKCCLQKLPDVVDAEKAEEIKEVMGRDWRTRKDQKG